MDVSLISWLMALGCLVGGGAIGYYLGSSSEVANRRVNENAERARVAEEKLDHYRGEVTGHLQKTAELMLKLATDYRDIRDHLTDGAQSLLSDQPLEATSALLELQENTQAAGLSKPTETTIPQQPPLDYAPKKDHQDGGVLDEKFGIDPPPDVSAPRPD